MERTLFAITCTTCQARLNVRNEGAIGQILTCPKCGSMVEVVPPPNWKPKPQPACGSSREEDAATATQDSERPETIGQDPSASPALEGPDGGAAGRQAPSVASAESTETAGKAQPPPLPPLAAADGPAGTSLPGAPKGGGAQEAEVWGQSAARLAPAELLWRKWLLLAASPVAGAVIAFGVWAAISSRGAPEPLPTPVADSPVEAPVADEPPAPPEEQEDPIRRLDPTWLPDGTSLVVCLRMSQLASREEFRLLVPTLGPAWPAIAGEVLAGFGLRSESIRRLSWASVDLAGFPDPGVVVIELEAGQDAGVFRRVGEPIGMHLNGQSCRRLAKGNWRHPFAVLDELTIVTGREELLGELATRSEPSLASLPIDRFLKSTPPDADAVALLDLSAAREAGWQLPISLLDVWPAGREPWHVVWEMPLGVALVCRHGGRAVTEIGLICEGETAAETVRGGLDQLIPAAQAVMEAQADSLNEKVGTGQITKTAAEPYQMLLSQGKTALLSARSELADGTVWLRIDWGEDASGLVAAALASQGTVQAEWLRAALLADETNHRRLVSGLQGYERAEGCFPQGAGGASLLPPETRLSWIAAMLPYYGHQDWHGELKFGYSWNSPQNRSVAQRPLDAVINPAIGPSRTEAGFPVTHYVGVAGVGPDAGYLEPGHPRAGVFGFNRTTRLQDITDGASTTIAVLGVGSGLGAWASGGAPTVRSLTRPPYVNGPDGFGNGQPNGMLAAMADGSVRFLRADIDPVVMRRLATISGAEDVTLAALEPESAKPPIPESGEAVPDPGQAAEQPSPSEEEGVPEPEADLAARPVEPGAEAVEVDVDARLADRIVQISFAGVPLGDVIDDIARMSTLPISFDLDALAFRGVTVRDRVTVRLENATVREILDGVLSGKNLAYAVENDQVVVTVPAGLRSALAPVTYTVSDLTGGGGAPSAELAELAQELVAPDSWRRAGGRGTIEPAEGVLKVTQTAPVHQQIVSFCEKLRIARRIPPRSGPDSGEHSLATRLDTARATLSQPVTANFHHWAPLARILSDLEQLTGATILVDRLSLGAEGLSPQVMAALTAQGQPLSEALDDLLRPLGLGYRVVEAETLEVTTQKALAARLELEFYPVGDLLAGGVTAAALIDRIEDQVAGATWADAGGPGLLRFDVPSKCLLVLQSQPVQRELESLLAEWRAEKLRP